MPLPPHHSPRWTVGSLTTGTCFSVCCCIPGACSRAPHAVPALCPRPAADGMEQRSQGLTAGAADLPRTALWSEGPEGRVRAEVPQEHPSLSFPRQ